MTEIEAKAQIIATDGFVRSIEWPDPTPKMLDTILFDTIWRVIKSWDINVPNAYSGYMGATGNHARAVYDALAPLLEATEARHAAELRELKERFSEAVEAYGRLWSKRTPSRDEYTAHFAPFIIPAPDPLVEAVGDALEAQGMGRPQHTTPEIAEHLRAAIEARGGKIVWEAGE